MGVLLHVLGVIFVVGGASAGVGRGRNSHRVCVHSYFVRVLIEVLHFRDLRKTLSHVTNSRTRQQRTVLIILVWSVKRGNTRLER